MRALTLKTVATAQSCYSILSREGLWRQWHSSNQERLGKRFNYVSLHFLVFNFGRMRFYHVTGCHNHLQCCPTAIKSIPATNSIQPWANSVEMRCCSNSKFKGRAEALLWMVAGLCQNPDNNIIAVFSFQAIQLKILKEKYLYLPIRVVYKQLKRKAFLSTRLAQWHQATHRDTLLYQY